MWPVSASVFAVLVQMWLWPVPASLCAGVDKTKRFAIVMPFFHKQVRLLPHGAACCNVV
jgi:hypothetical protein